LVTQIETKGQADGAIKMFIAGSLATGILFLGVSFYLLGGGDLLSPLAKEGSSFETLGLLLILGGVFYKLTIVPFHGWAADSYALVKQSHAGLLSGVAKTVVAIALFEIFRPFITLHTEMLNPIVIALALVTMTLANFLALFRKNLALMLSYSSIAYIFMQSAAFLHLYLHCNSSH